MLRSRFALQFTVRPAAIVLLSLSLLAAACGNNDEDAAPPVDENSDTSAVTDEPADSSSTDASTDEDAGSSASEPATMPADFATAAAAGQITVTGATPGTELTLRGPGAEQVGTVDEFGNLLFRQVEPGEGWQGLAPLPVVLEQLSGVALALVAVVQLQDRSVERLPLFCLSANRFQFDGRLSFHETLQVLGFPNTRLGEVWLVWVINPK